MSYLIRTRSNGRSFELRIKSKLLPKAIYFTFDSEAEAESFAKTAETFLAKGIVPESLLATPKLAFTDIAGAIRAYEKASAVPRSTSNVLDAVSANIGPTKLSAVDYAWAEAWILGQKLQHQRAPGTIRHHVGALSRALDWVTRRHPTYLAQNPLCQLPRGYATYNSAERRTLAATGVDAKRDTERNRRLEPEEEEAIVALLEERIAKATDPATKRRHTGALLLFLLALETAMRLREIYTLEWCQIDLAKHTVFLTRAKNGETREVPTSSVAERLLREAMSRRESSDASELLLPFWNHDVAPAVLEATTSRLSAYFGELFEEAGCADLVYHDTRHEAICRLVIRTKLSSTQIARISGHRDPRMLRRYMSLRGSELAQHLW